MSASVGPRSGWRRGSILQHGRNCAPNTAQEDSHDHQEVAFAEGLVPGAVGRTHWPEYPYDPADRARPALQYVQGLKTFYGHLANYVLFIGIFTVLWYVKLGHIPNWILYWAGGWGIGLIIHALITFEVFNFLGFGPEWERSQVEKRLKRKL